MSTTRRTVHRITLLAGVAAAAVATAGHPTFLTGITKPTFGSNPPEVYLANADGSNTFLFDAENYQGVVTASAPGFTGLAADDANNRWIASTTAGLASNLYAIDYDTLDATFLASVRDPRPDDDALVIDGLAYDSTRGVLYATKVLGGSTGAEALYTIDLATGQAAIAFEYETTATSSFQIGGIDYDPQTDLIYLADDDDTGGRWIYSVDPTNPGAGLTEVVNYADLGGVIDVDGLGASNGVLFLLSDGTNPASPDAGNGGFHRLYDLATGQVIASPATPFPAYSDSVIGPINPSGAAAAAPTGADCPADLVGGDGVLNIDDVLAFVDAFALGDPAADFAPPTGTLNIDDVLAYLDAFAAGCP